MPSAAMMRNLGKPWPPKVRAHSSRLCYARKMSVFRLYAALPVFAFAILFAGEAVAEEPVAQAPARNDAIAAPTPERTPENADAVRSATQHFDTGMVHYRARRFRDAIREFELAASTVPSADLWFNIARAHEQLSDWGDAAEFYRKYLRDRVDPQDRAAVEEHIAALEERAEAERMARRQAPTTGSLRIESTFSGANLRMDGSDVGHTPIAEPLSTTPGSHALDLRATNRIPARAQANVTAGLTSTAFLEVPPMTRYRSIRGKRLWTWIAGGVALATLGTAAVLEIEANRGDHGGHTTGAMRAADYTLGAGIVLAVTSIILYFVEGRSVGTERIADETPASN